MDALLSHVILLLKSEGVKILNLGFCPARLERPKWGWESCIHGLYYGGWGFYPEGLYRFKKKYSDIEEPQFFLVDPRKAVLPQCYNMVCATLFDAKKISEN